MSRGRQKKYSHKVCKECKSQNYDIMETRCNSLSYSGGFRDNGIAGHVGVIAEVRFYCLECGFEDIL